MLYLFFFSLFVLRSPFVAGFDFVDPNEVLFEVDGELVELYDGFGVYSSNSLSYSYNGINYKIYSNDLTVAELINIANGMETVAIK